LGVRHPTPFSPVIPAKAGIQPLLPPLRKGDFRS
jgi:hypothetical protein